MKEFDISEKYKRIYAGINNWKNAGNKGIFQYTERIDIPLVINTWIEVINLCTDRPNYNIIVTPDLKYKDTFKKSCNNKAVIMTITEFLELAKKSKATDDIYCSSFALMDITNILYWTNSKFIKTWQRVKTDKFLGITTKVISHIMAKNFAQSNIPIVDVITRSDALENGWISPTIIYNVGIEFSSEEKTVYKSLSENISKTLSIFKGKAKMINTDFKKLTNCRIDLIRDDFSLIKACVLGVNYVNDLNDKSEHIHSDIIRNMLASIMGWSKDMDMTNDYNKQVDMYWNPDNIKSRAQSFIDAVDKRVALYSNNANKRKAIDYIIKNFKCKTIVLSQDKSISDYIETIPECMSWYKGMKSRICFDESGKPYLYASGAKKGEPKVFGELGIKKEAIKNFSTNRVNCIATDEVANSAFDIENLGIIVCTAPYCKPFYTVGDDKKQSPYINKVPIIIWLYMQDFTIDSDDYTSSKEKERLIEAQKSVNTDIIWVNSISDIKIA